MARISCFSGILAGKKKNNKYKGSSKPVDVNKSSGNGKLRVNPEEYVYSSSIKNSPEQASLENSLLLNSVSNSPSIYVKKPPCNDKDKNLARCELAVESAYEGGDEHDDSLSIKRDHSELDLQALAAQKSEIDLQPDSNRVNNNCSDIASGKVEGITFDFMIQSGHVSDPGMGRTTFWASPVLKRSCSNIETNRSSKLLNQSRYSRSPNNPQNLSGDFETEAPNGSPSSVMTSCSADKVMLKKRSSSQVLPSRSRKLWWKLFLWSHRNLHKPFTSEHQRIVSVNHASNQKAGYNSDTLETTCKVDLKMKRPLEEPETKFSPDLWPEYQWVAFAGESPCLDRVDAWVHSLKDCVLGDDEKYDGEAAEPICFAEIGECSNKNQTSDGKRAVEEIIQANTIIRSMNFMSSVAHIACMGLKVIPAISAFASLRAVNLSGNSIVQISPGSLPKSLHTLDMSRNKINAIEGLRELTRLRVLNLSYNRISRIGHGLSNCTLIKELYLAGNKISDVEGLHRLLKLTVLDLSFNKITTAKALGQLVANYSSLLALNLIGNPIQSNIGDEQLRKAVCSLLPHLSYLNKQPIKTQRAREVATDSVAKAALGNGSWGSRRRSGRRVVGQSPGASSVKGRIMEGSSHRGAGSNAVHKNSKSRQKNRHSTRK